MLPLECWIQSFIASTGMAVWMGDLKYNLWCEGSTGTFPLCHQPQKICVQREREICSWPDNSTILKRFRVSLQLRVSMNSDHYCENRKKREKFNMLWRLTGLPLPAEISVISILVLYLAHTETYTELWEQFHLNKKTRSSQNKVWGPFCVALEHNMRQIYHISILSLPNTTWLLCQTATP